MRFIGLDVHRDFCAIAISENGHVRFAGKIQTTPEQLEILAQSLGPDDQVALEATSTALPIARILQPHVARVVVATKRDLEAIAQSRADRIDAKILARLLSAGLLAGRLATRRDQSRTAPQADPPSVPAPRTRSTRS